MTKDYEEFQNYNEFLEFMREDTGLGMDSKLSEPDLSKIYHDILISKTVYFTKDKIIKTVSLSEFYVLGSESSIEQDCMEKLEVFNLREVCFINIELAGTFYLSEPNDALKIESWDLSGSEFAGK